MAEFALEVSASARLSTQFHVWYPHFVRVTMRSVVLDLPESFVECLTEDGIVLLRRATRHSREPWRAQ